LPLLTSRGIEAALRRLPEDEIDTALRERIFAAAWAPGTIHYAAGSRSAQALAAAAGLEVRAIADPDDLKSVMQRLFSRRLDWLSAGSLPATLPGWSARLRLTPAQAGFAVVFAAAAVAAAVLVPGPVLRMALGLIFSLFFLMVIALRVLSALPLPEVPKPQPPALWPVYTVLAPLHRETAVLHQLLRALSRIDYPHHLLDIKLVIESDDTAMRRALDRLTLPAHMEVIVVPPAGPQTKPKALNYALAFARGELLTIYDAEDIPHPGQLRAAAAAFAEAEPRTACLQAELTFYNPIENWLARQFTAEYAWLFGRLLPVLGHLDLPILLGGTSNHFRTEVLRRIGAWDAYNVTEDADLGLRLARFGYRADVLPSRTCEEANCRLGNWMKQRARWLKGWMQTWIVHMRSPLRLSAGLGARGFWTAQAMLLGVIVSALFHPVFLGLTLWSILTGEMFPQTGGWLITVSTGLSLAVLIMGYAAAICAAHLGLRRMGYNLWAGTLLTMPAYWLLISAAAWLALWQLLAAPFHWNKTEHGISRAARTVGSVPPARPATPLPSPSRVWRANS
jgi:cellulose synthase/poly-beta-1,6-N-acetylglucosamine synthase-like glycosyltransferase